MMINHNIAIKVEKLSKLYQLGEFGSYKTLRETLVKTFTSPWRRHQPQKADESKLWALKDVTFTIGNGEVVGVIGRNGAGKSTLLKILSRITRPTEGSAEIHGRVGSLLEVGTAFHPELSGRDNIYLNGAVLGMKKKEIDRKFNEIVEFSGVAKFVDTPLKRYSTGMQVRLAFAVAAHLEPEILLVDEVLAVGDAAFQKKCLGKMQDVSRGGRTILFVSHNMTAVQGLCTRTIWLDEGKIVEDGQTGSVVADYLKTSFSTLTEQVWEDINTAPGNDKVRLHRARVRPELGSASDAITIRTPFVIECEYWNLQASAHLNLTLLIYNEQGVQVFASGPIKEPVWHGRPFPVGLFRSVCHVPGELLNDGTHRVTLMVVKDQSVVIYNQADILAFDVRDVVEMRGSWYGKWPGAVRPNLEWSTELITESIPLPTGSKS